MSAGLFLLAGGRDDWTPREPVLGCIPIRSNHGGSVDGRGRSRDRTIVCEAVDCEVSFKPRTPKHSTCSIDCARSIRSSVRES